MVFAFLFPFPSAETSEEHGRDGSVLIVLVACRSRPLFGLDVAHSHIAPSRESRLFAATTVYGISSEETAPLIKTFRGTRKKNQERNQ